MDKYKERMRQAYPKRERDAVTILPFKRVFLLARK